MKAYYDACPPSVFSDEADLFPEWPVSFAPSHVMKIDESECSRQDHSTVLNGTIECTAQPLNSSVSGIATKDNNLQKTQRRERKTNVRRSTADRNKALAEAHEKYMPRIIETLGSLMRRTDTDLHCQTAVLRNLYNQWRLSCGQNAGEAHAVPERDAYARHILSTDLSSADFPSSERPGTVPCDPSLPDVSSGSSTL